MEVVSLFLDSHLDEEPFWAGCNSGKLMLPYCPACTRFSYYPRMHCVHCGNRTVNWKQSSGAGSVYSFAHVHFSPFGKHWTSELPYCVVQVDLAEGVRFLSRLVGDDRLDVAIGDPVEVLLAAVVDSERRLPVFTRVRYA